MLKAALGKPPGLPEPQKKPPALAPVLAAAQQQPISTAWLYEEQHAAAEKRLNHLLGLAAGEPSPAGPRSSGQGSGGGCSVCCGDHAAASEGLTALWRLHQACSRCTGRQRVPAAAGGESAPPATDQRPADPALVAWFDGLSAAARHAIKPADLGPWLENAVQSARERLVSPPQSPAVPAGVAQHQRQIDPAQ